MEITCLIIIIIIIIIVWFDNNQYSRFHVINWIPSTDVQLCGGKCPYLYGGVEFLSSS